MQIVYSAGSTPNPSPRLQRKPGYSRPIMPGYMTHVHPQILVQRSREKLTEGDIPLRDSIPAMSKCVAGLCLLLNIFLPGSGTLMSGLSVLCCSHVRPKGDSKGHCIWVNAGVGLVQFVLTFLFLMGWIWSIMWGVAFLSVSRQYYYRKDDKDDNRGKHTGVEKATSKMNGTSKRDQQAGSISKKCHSQDLESRFHEKSPNHNLEHHKIRASHVSQSAGSSEHFPSTSTDNVVDLNIQRADLSLLKLSQALEVSDEDSGILPRQPIIVLQQAPVGSQVDTCHIDPRADTGETIMKASTRHMKMLQRKMSDNDLSPFVLTHKQLEAIVIHDLPVRAPDIRQTTIPENPTDVLQKC